MLVAEGVSIPNDPTGDCDIGHLTVIAGPTAVGKSWLIGRLRKDEELARDSRWRSMLQR